MKVDWKKEAEEADSHAKQNAVAESQPKFRLLPGDPVKGTRYQGVIKNIVIEPFSNTEKENFGRDMLTVTVVVTNGAHNGYTEKFTRVLNPVSIDQPSEEAVENRIAELVKTKKFDERSALTEVIEDWKKWRANYRRQTYTMLAKLGVDIESGDDEQIVKELAHKINQPVEFTIYDANEKTTRRKFLEFGKVKTDESVVSEKESKDSAHLFEDLPDGNDLPLN